MEEWGSAELDCNRYVGVLHKVSATFTNYIINIVIWFIARVKDFLFLLFCTAVSLNGR